ncbi:MAG: hypothetical protein JF615_05620 [Asticcacaulis sp.]|nr:hypothetical protein [Asticcacaulis sp.]
MLKTTCLTAILALTLTAGVAQADSLGNVSKASGDSAVALAELTESGVKVIAGAVALPFIVAGTAGESIGGAVRDSGQDVWDAANEPLTVSPETVTAQPAPDVPYDRQNDRQDNRNDDRRN